MMKNIIGFSIGMGISLIGAVMTVRYGKKYFKSFN